MEQESIYALNPEYFLKPDKNRALISNKGGDPRIKDFMGFVHPVYAILLSLFDGEKKLDQVISIAAKILKKDSAIISNIITPLLENEEELYFQFDGCHFSFPTQVLVKRNRQHIHNKLNPESFFIPKKDLDFETRRLNTPLDALFMVNTRCVTNCVYCYVDRGKNMDCDLPVERLKKLIREAKELEIRNINITGGELFLYKNWQVLLSELLTNGFTPYISTKCPIDEKTICELKDMGLKQIQISIDSIVSGELCLMLKVKPDYAGKLVETLRTLDKKGFEIYTNTQVTSINQGSIPQLLDFLLSLKNIKRINMGAAAFSLYLGEAKYKAYKANLEALEQLKTKVETLSKQHEGKVSLNFSGYYEKSGLIGKSKAEKKKDFNGRARCSGNFYSFTILPDGKVTVCEELYWHPKFIISDLSKQSIEEMWNSTQALDFYNISQEKIRAESRCKECEAFDPCHKNQGVCWKEVLYAYGVDNWDYPDPKCPYASEPNHEYYLS